MLLLETVTTALLPARTSASLSNPAASGPCRGISVVSDKVRPVMPREYTAIPIVSQRRFSDLSHWKGRFRAFLVSKPDPNDELLNSHPTSNRIKQNESRSTPSLLSAHRRAPESGFSRLAPIS